MKMQIARIATQLVRQRNEEFLRDLSMPLTVRGMINVHMTGWIADFWSVAIRPVKSGSESYLDFPIGLGEDGTVWFFPSRQWWVAHAQVSHSPVGEGCDVDVHTKFLTSEGDAHEFDYATVLLDGTMKILGRADFVEEYAWWERAFGRATQP
jgi:hypothetical protein